MSKLTIMEAVKVIPISESKLRRDLKAGKCSFTTSKNGKKVIDASELERVYGLVDTTENSKNGNGGHDTSHECDYLKSQIADLRNQLERAEVREDTHIAEKKELHDRLAAEQEKTRLLMLPKPEPENEGEKPRGWLQRLIGA